MSWLHSNITSTNTKSEKFLDLYKQNTRQIARNVTEYRLDKYSNQEKIFEIDLDLVGRESSLFHNPNLPYSNIRNIITRNSKIWKDELYRVIDSGEAHIDEDNISALKTIHSTDYALIYWSDYTIKDNKLYIKDIENNIYTYNLNFNSSIIGDIPNDSILRLYPSKKHIELKTNHNGPENINLSSISLNNHQEKESLYSKGLIRMILAYHNVYPTVQIDISQDYLSKFENIFSALNLTYYRPVEGSSLVTSRDSNEDKIQSFIDTPKVNRSLEQYYSLLGYPLDNARRLEEMKKEYGNLSGEEFIIYGRQNDKITEELASYIYYVPYMPKPNVDSMLSALNETRNNIELVKTSSTEIPTKRIENTRSLVDKYKRDNYGSRLDVLDNDIMLI